MYVKKKILHIYKQNNILLEDKVRNRTLRRVKETTDLLNPSMDITE
jgi:hypothetical protein